jgi:uncharacterized protein (DUF1330 family)
VDRRTVLSTAPASILVGGSSGPARAATALAYVVNEIVVTDPAGYAEYARLAPVTIQAFGGRYIVRGGDGLALIGEPPASRVVIVEFPSRQAALDWHASPDYQAVLRLREAASTSRVYIVDGVPA